MLPVACASATTFSSGTVIRLYHIPGCSRKSSGSVDVILQCDRGCKAMGACMSDSSESEQPLLADYQHCNLTDVPEEIFGFVASLQVILLDSNALKQLPKVRRKLRRACYRMV